MKFSTNIKKLFLSESWLLFFAGTFSIPIIVQLIDGASLFHPLILIIIAFIFGVSLLVLLITFRKYFMIELNDDYFLIKKGYSVIINKWIKVPYENIAVIRFLDYTKLPHGKMLAPRFKSKRGLFFEFHHSLHHELQILELEVQFVKNYSGLVNHLFNVAKGDKIVNGELIENSVVTV